MDELKEGFRGGPPTKRAPCDKLGILGREIVAALSKDSSTWTTVHALSRSQKEDYPSQVKHDTIDLTGDVEKMAKQLQGVEAECVFFAAYLANGSDQEDWDVNGRQCLIRPNLTTAGTGAIKKVKWFILTTGAKQYGLQLRAIKNPMQESDLEVVGPDRPPDFYYNLQNIIKAEAKKASWDWVVTYPCDVLGLAKNNLMNLMSSLVIYGAVYKEQEGEMPFPGSEKFYTMCTTFTDAALHAQFVVRAAQKPECGNQEFNVVNGDA
ncbi:hypothetical protein MMC30_008469 [Trapelia coarctata]|nr:hypothetical protein [Trapelia coarctata]